MFNNLALGQGTDGHIKHKMVQVYYKYYVLLSSCLTFCTELFFCEDTDPQCHLSDADNFIWAEPYVDNHTN